MTFQLGDMVTIPALSSYKRGMVVSKPRLHHREGRIMVVKVLWFGRTSAIDTYVQHLVKVEEESELP